MIPAVTFLMIIEKPAQIQFLGYKFMFSDLFNVIWIVGIIINLDTDKGSTLHRKNINFHIIHSRKVSCI